MSAVPLGGLTAFTRMQVDGKLPTPVQKLYARALRTIGAAIVRGPVQFAGNAQGAPEFSFQPGTNRGGRILVRGDVWREFSLMGHWIRDAVVLRWSRMTARLSEGGVQPGAVINRSFRMPSHFGRTRPSGSSTWLTETSFAVRGQTSDLGQAWTWITPFHSHSGRQVQPGTCFPHLRA